MCRKYQANLCFWASRGEVLPPSALLGSLTRGGVSLPGTLEWEDLELPLTCSVWPGGSWSTLASDIFDCCYLASKLSRGGVYAFRTACVSKAGMGPYSSPSEQVHLGGPRHLGEPLQDLVGIRWWSLWNCPATSPKYIQSLGRFVLPSMLPLHPPQMVQRMRGQVWV